MTAVWSEPFDLARADDDPNPFVAFRAGLVSHALAMQHGMSDAEYVDHVRAFDEAIAKVEGAGFLVTPWRRDDRSGLWWKDETANVGGSHKARHLFGLALTIEMSERTGRVSSGQLGSKDHPLAIASCGNAALAAAVVARAWGRSLRVFIPTDADPIVVERLDALDAQIVRCDRNADAPPGDPCFHAFRRAVRAGAVPFTCQGTENGLVIDGGVTLGYEIAREIQRGRAARLDRLFIQVGGGALASATIQAFHRTALSPPAIHATQTASCAPIYDAWQRLGQDLERVLTVEGKASPRGMCTPTGPESDRGRAAWLRPHANTEIAARVFQRAALHRSRYMRPVTAPAISVASGILDDETYDWFAIVHAMIQTGGWPVLVDEPDLILARDQANREFGVPADATGSAGLAGVNVARTDHPHATDEVIGVLLTGRARRPQGKP